MTDIMFNECEMINKNNLKNNITSKYALFKHKIKTRAFCSNLHMPINCTTNEWFMVPQRWFYE